MAREPTHLDTFHIQCLGNLRTCSLQKGERRTGGALPRNTSLNALETLRANDCVIIYSVGDDIDDPSSARRIIVTLRL